MKARKFDKIFDSAGSDIINHLDMATLRRSNQELKRVGINLPAWMINSLDREAGKLGVTRQSIIKVWLAERLEAVKSR
ncbi:MAG: BrnA antitoxin family protein [Burkholderiales bacterium]|nr:BrnA antitoxin family protein [Burkholderiales bacterium]